MKGTIKSKEQISWMFAHGSKHSVGSFLALYKNNSASDNSNCGRSAFVAGKKLGSAPLRNKAKRRLREAARSAGAPWSGYDVVFVARARVMSLEHSQLIREMERLREKLYLEQEAGGGQAAGGYSEENSGEESVSCSEESSNQEAGTLSEGCAEQEADGCCKRSPAEEFSSFDEEEPQENATKTTIGSLIVGIPRNIALLCITIYRHAISPLFPPSCRYVPTCSEYAMIAFKRFGFWKGLFLSIKRVGRCHPLAKGGYDPVPEAKSNKASIL